MKILNPLLRRARSFVRDFAADHGGIAAVEFAMIAPVMLVLFFGVMEASTGVAIDRKVTMVARTLSDLTAQSAATITDANLLNAFTAGISVVTPYDASKTKGTISQVYVDAKGIATVQWSKSATVASASATQATLTASARSAGDKVTATIPGTLLVPSTYLIMSEVSYDYDPGVKFVFKSNISLHDVSYSRPRQVTCIAYGGAPASC